MKKLRSLLFRIRELLWPLLESENEIKCNEKTIEECLWNKNEESMILEYIEIYSKSEENRNTKIESKSMIFIGTFSVIIALLTLLIKDINIDSATNTPRQMFLIGAIILIIIYLCRAIWFSIKALERREYHTLGFPDFMFSNSTEKKKKIILKCYNNTKKNQRIINLKVDYMTMAQEYFKRAIFCIGVFSGIELLSYIVPFEKIMIFLPAVIMLFAIAIILYIIIE